MPLHPYWPNSPVFAGMNGCQLAEFTYMKPKPITSMTIAILTNTMTLLNRADSWMPMTSSVVRIADEHHRGDVQHAVNCWYFVRSHVPAVISAFVAGSTQSTERTSVCVPSTPNGADVNCRGMWMPICP